MRQACSPLSTSGNRSEYDLIDLTLLPPPGTPDEDTRSNTTSSASSSATSGSPSMPPTPFADRQALEAEFRTLNDSDWNKNTPGR